MQANWSLILNVLLLTGVVVAIVRILKTRRQTDVPVRVQPSVGMQVEKMDEVIAVRKINRESTPAMHEPVMTPRVHGGRNQTVAASGLNLDKQSPGEPNLEKHTFTKPNTDHEHPVFLVIFLLAKENRQLAGYELLQTILSAGLRFGEGHLFHRHQHPNGQGPILCSLATATASGVFDLQNIGAFSVHGLCLFMQTSGSSTIDMERFHIMVDTAKKLSEGLDTHVLDDERKAWSEASERRYARGLNEEEIVEVA